MSEGQYKTSIIKRTAIRGFNLIPLSVARSLIVLIFNIGLKRSAGFFARHYPIRGLTVFQVNGEKVSFVNDGSYISQTLFFLGAKGYEEYEVNIWKHLCANATTIYEVGGNIGFFSVFGAAAAPSTHYKVYEPNPITLKSLYENVSINHLNNVEVVGAAVVGESDINEISLHIPVQETGRQATGAYIDNSEGIDRPSIESFTVPVEYAGDFCGVDLLKLDVEGSEHQILAAMEESLTKSQPIIMVEVRRRTPKLREWIMNFVEENNYQIWAISSPVLKRVPVNIIMKVILQEEYGTRDLLLVPFKNKNVVREFT